MPCHSAMISKPVKVKPDEAVESVLKKMKKAKSEYAVVVNKDGEFEGLFSNKILIKNLLPVSVAMAGGLQLDMNIKAAPGVAKRYQKVMPLPVSNIMERKANFVLPQTPTWEGINAIVQKGAPLIVVEDENLKFLGLITAASAVEDLENIDA